MAYVVAIASLVFMTAIKAHASQYSCIDTGNGAEVVVEAASTTEAEYKASANGNHLNRSTSALHTKALGMKTA